MEIHKGEGLGTACAECLKGQQACSLAVSIQPSLPSAVGFADAEPQKKYRSRETMDAKVAEEEKMAVQVLREKVSMLEKAVSEQSVQITALRRELKEY